MKPHRIIDIDAAREGMRLYGDLRDRAGNLLLPKATVLTAAIINGLRRRAVEVLSVLDESVTERQLAAAREQALVRIAHLFRHAGNGAATLFLREAVERYRMKELA